MDKKIILGFVGEIASGKGTACKYLEEKHNASSHRFSTIIRDVLDRLYLPQSRENLQKMSTVLRKNFSEDIFAKVIAEDVKKDGHKIIAVDGVRRLADIKYLKEIEGFYLVYLTADQKTRYERIIKRSENIDDIQKTFEEFQEDEKAEAEQQIKETTKSAYFTINNNGTLEELYQQIENILEKIK